MVYAKRSAENITDNDFEIDKEFVRLYDKNVEYFLHLRFRPVGRYDPMRRWTRFQYFFIIAAIVLFLNFAPCKVIQESLGFRIPRCGFRIPCLWIPDSTSMDSGFHNQQPG